MLSAPARLCLAAFPGGCRQAVADIARQLGRGAPAWVVGGAVRRVRLGEAVADLDVAVPSGALALGRALADRLRSAYVLLDERRGACRVLASVPIDLTDLRAPSIEDDLRGRDFTVNALAVSLPELVGRGEATIQDPTGGLRDLAARHVRLCAPDALEQDPVRVLRAARLAIQPGWSLGAATEAAMARAAARTPRVSAERLREELIGILATPAAGAGLRLLDRVGAMQALLPESLPMRETAQSAPHRFDVWEHSLRAVEAADPLLAELDALEPWGNALALHLVEDLGDRLTRRELLKLAALLHDVAKPETLKIVDGRTRFFEHDRIGAERATAIAARFRLSGHANAALARLVRHHLRPMHLAQAGGLTRRARYRFFQALGEEARDLVLLALCDAAAVRGESALAVWTGPGGALLRELMRGVEEDAVTATTPPLLRGEDVMEAFGLEPGPEVGRRLGLAREAQALGLVGDRQSALDYLRRAGDPALDTPGEGP